MDAAVATGFALAVTYPRAGNIGGGGFMVIHSTERNEDVAIDYRDVTRVGNIDENSVTLFLQLKSFGMRRQFDRPDLFSVGCVNNSNTSTAKSHVDFFPRFIITDIVGIIFKIQFPDRLE